MMRRLNFQTGLSGRVNPGEVVVTKIRFAPHEENGLNKLYFESSELESGENVIYGNIKKELFHYSGCLKKWSFSKYVN